MSSCAAPGGGTLKEMLAHLDAQVQTAVKNNVAHATATTNAWRDAVTQTATAASAFALLSYQSGDSSSLRQIQASTTLQRLVDQLSGMKLVFDTATRQKLLKDAIKALQDSLQQVKEVEGRAGSAPAATHTGTGSSE